MTWEAVGVETDWLCLLPVLRPTILSVCAEATAFLFDLIGSGGFFIIISIQGHAFTLS